MSNDKQKPDDEPKQDDTQAKPDKVEDEKPSFPTLESVRSYTVVPDRKKSNDLDS